MKRANSGEFPRSGENAYRDNPGPSALPAAFMLAYELPPGATM
jgi:hypothetical protein